jgi:hypothetical protein
MRKIAKRGRVDTRTSEPAVGADKSGVAGEPPDTCATSECDEAEEKKKVASTDARATATAVAATDARATDARGVAVVAATDARATDTRAATDPLSGYGCDPVRLPTSLRAHCLAHLDLATLYVLHRVSRTYIGAIERHLAHADAILLSVRDVRPPGTQGKDVASASAPVATARALAPVPDDVADFAALRLAARFCVRLAHVRINLGQRSSPTGDGEWNVRPLRMHLESTVLACVARNLPTLRTIRISGLCESGSKALLAVAGNAPHACATLRLTTPSWRTQTQRC